MRSHHDILSDAQRLTKQIRAVLSARKREEQARRVRRTYQAEVRVLFGQDADSEAMFRASEIGPTGLFLHSALLLEPGVELSVRFPTPQGRDEVRARGHVESVSTSEDPRGPGMQITFYELAGAIEALGAYTLAA